MSQEKKSLVKRFISEVWEEGNRDIIDEVLSEDYVDHNLPEGIPPGREGVKQFTSMYLRAFPNPDVEMEDLIAEGDKVVLRWSASASHRGEFMGVPPTNKRVKMTGIEILRFSGGKIVERWGLSDQAGLLQQLGVMPEIEAA